MAPMKSPYQCMESTSSFLFAASGSWIYVFSLENGSRLASGECKPLGVQWETPFTQLPGKEAMDKEEEVPEPKRSDSSPPAKKRRLSDDGGSQAKPESPQEMERSQRSKVIKEAGVNLEAPFITAMAVTASGQHVVVVTGEDKSIRVFEKTLKDGSFTLEQISCRCVSVSVWQVLLC